MPKKNGNSLQYHLAFLQKAKERRRWSVASIPSYGFGSITPMNSNSQCSLNIDENNSCSCLQNGSYHHISSQTNSQSTFSAVSSVSPKLYHSGLVHTLAQHFSSNDSNPSLDEDGRLLSTVPYFRPRSRSLSSPVRSPAIDSKTNLNLSTSKENLNYSNSQNSPIKLGTLTFRRRSRSLSSPIRSPGIENRFVQMSYVYKERFPNAIKQMNEKLEKFVNDNPELIPEIASDAVTRFVHHQAIEMAKDCLQKSKDELLTSNYFYEMTEGLEKLLTESKEKSSSAVQHLKKLIKQLMLIVSRPARLLECLEFNPEEFYRFLEAAEGQAKTIQGIKKDLPQYIINKLGLTKDPLTEFNQLNEHLFENVNSIDKQNKLEKDESLNSSLIKLPSEKDYETIKLISNGAYGAVYLVKHIETNQRFAMKKINKQNLALRNQIEQAFAERDIMCFTDNPFVVSLFCSFETKLYLCMVMEYVEGGDCATLLKSMGPLPVDLAKFYFAETVLAVEYLHSYGIVHRDLKPDNLLITALGHIKLTDFGLSKIGLMNLATNLYEGYLDKDTKQFNDKQVYGTPEYIAPEVILRQGYGKPVDWWSMGIILYEFLIGCVPFFGETAEELFSHVINDEIEWPSNDDWPLPEEAKILITQFLMPNPIDRLGTSGAAEVKDHPFFDGINWDALLRQKAEFVPQLIDEDDTSYFDTRLDRYNHDLEDSEGFNDSDDSPLFSSFSSCSPRYHKVYSKLEKSIEKEKILSSIEDTKQSSQIFANESSSSSKSSTNRHLNELSYDESSKETYDSTSNKKEKLHEAFNKQLAIKDILKFVADSDKIDPNEKINSIKENKEENYLKTDEVNQFENEKRPLTPSIKETPPDDSNYDEKDNSGEENKSYDENKLSLTTKIRPVTKSASASGLSQIIFEPKTQRRFTLLDNRHLEHEENCLASSNNKSSLAVQDQTDLFKNALNKSKLNKNLLESSPSKQFSRHSGYLRKSSLRQIGSPYCSSASSRDNSPSHDLINKRKSLNKLQNSDKLSADINLNSSLNNLCKLKPPVILRKSNRGFGFSFKAIRVYYGDSDIYTVHHLVMNVEPNSPAFEAGLKTGDLITHINSEPLQGLLHHQVLQLVLSGGDSIQIRTTPLETTSIKSGGRKRNPNAIRLAKRGTGVNKHFYSHKKSYSGLTHSSNEISTRPQNTLSPTILKRNDSEKKRKNSSLIRRLSSKRSSTDIQQLVPTCSNACLQDDLNSKITSSKSFQHLNKEDKSQANLNQQCNSLDPSQNISSDLNASYFSKNINNSSNVSTPVSNKSQLISPSQYSRPNTLHGLKHKLVQTFRSPRRKSCGNIPLSPLARTSSPSSACLNSSSGSNLVAESPTRSPSPLAFSNNGQQTNYRHSQQYHRHNHRQNSSTHCQLQFNNCTSSNTLKPTNSSSGSSTNQGLSPCITVNCTSNKSKAKNLAQSPVIESDDNNSVTSLDSNYCKFSSSLSKSSHDSSSSHGVSKQKTNRY